MRATGSIRDGFTAIVPYGKDDWGASFEMLYLPLLECHRHGDCIFEFQLEEDRTLEFLTLVQTIVNIPEFRRYVCHFHQRDPRCCGLAAIVINDLVGHLRNSVWWSNQNVAVARIEITRNQSLPAHAFIGLLSSSYLLLHLVLQHVPTWSSPLPEQLYEGPKFRYVIMFRTCVIAHLLHPTILSSSINHVELRRFVREMAAIHKTTYVFLSSQSDFTDDACMIFKNDMDMHKILHPETKFVNREPYEQFYRNRVTETLR